MSKASRLRGLRASIIDRIKAEYWDEVEADYDRAVPIHATDAEGSLWLLAHAQHHGYKFDDDQQRAKEKEEFPAAVNHPRDVQHDGPNLKGMTSRERHEWADKNPAQAAALLAAAAARAAKK